MRNARQSASSGGTVAPGSTPSQGSSTLAFSLVVIMLGTLTLLLLVLLIFTRSNSGDPNMVEYSKWALTTLLGTFGAWIGAGAAYFFGRENLNESSRSTAEALKIQQKTLRGVQKPERIRELVLTTMDREFMFKLTATKGEVTAKLAQPQYRGYWWVPVLDEGGTLVDSFHARVFWDTAFNDNDPISTIVSNIDTNANLKALHGTSFFVRVALDDEIADVIGNMKKSGAAVGIIVDEKGKPTYCFTKQDLLNVQK